MPYEMITFDDLEPLIGTPRAPAILDLRIEEDRAADPVVIPGSVGVDYTDLSSAAPQAEALVVVCHKGLKISHGAAALLSRTHTVSVLSGGMRQWIEAGGPTVLPDALAQRWVQGNGNALPHYLCRWLLQRFGGPGTEVLSVPASEIDGVADRYGARRAGDDVEALAEAIGLDWAPLTRVWAMAHSAGTDIEKGLQELGQTDRGSAESAAFGLADLWLAAARADAA